MNEINDSHIYNKNTEGAFSKCFHGTVGVGCGCVFLLIILPLIFFVGLASCGSLISNSNSNHNNNSSYNLKKRDLDYNYKGVKNSEIKIPDGVMYDFKEMPIFDKDEILGSLKELYPNKNLTIDYIYKSPSIEVINPLEISSDEEIKLYGWYWLFSTKEPLEMIDISNNQGTTFIAIYDTDANFVAVDTFAKIKYKPNNKKVLEKLEDAPFAAGLNMKILSK